MLALRASKGLFMQCIAGPQRQPAAHVIISRQQGRHVSARVMHWIRNQRLAYSRQFDFGIGHGLRHTHDLRIRRTGTQQYCTAEQGASQSALPQQQGLTEIMFVTGFSSEQLQQLHDNVVQQVPVVIAALTTESCSHTMESLLTNSGVYDQSAGSLQDSTLLGRMVLITGNIAAPLAMHLNDILADLGQPPAIIAAKQPRHDSMLVKDVLRSIRAAHLQYYGLYQPLLLLPDPIPPNEAQVVMNVVLDAGQVPTPQGGLREDVSHLVVLDGLCSEEERGGILDWLTAPDHDHQGPPPNHKWEMGCVDRTGDNPTWGLTTEMLRALQEDPPHELLTLQTKLATLYPEWDIGHMPATAMSDPDEVDEAEPLSSFVGNAVMAADPCHWHVDADPSVLSGEAPWVQQYGWYVNREPGRPLFVSALLYINDEWPEDLDAETLFLDPAAQAGVFVRPSPGRLVLMDQDMTHRISPPAPHTEGPRYSLVWKLVFFPKAGNTSSSISRPEWGPPVRLGSAAGRIPAYHASC